MIEINAVSRPAPHQPAMMKISGRPRRADSSRSSTAATISNDSYFLLEEKPQHGGGRTGSRGTKRLLTRSSAGPSPHRSAASAACGHQLEVRRSPTRLLPAREHASVSSRQRRPPLRLLVERSRDGLLGDPCRTAVLLGRPYRPSEVAARTGLARVTSLSPAVVDVGFLAEVLSAEAP